MIHLRNAPDLGGVYFASSLVGHQVVLWVSCWVYVDNYEGASGKFDRDLVFVCVGVLSAVWFASHGTFLLLINRSYLRTFVSIETGSEYAIRNFRDAEGNDEVRFAIFDMNVRKWSSIRGEVDLWVKCNYNKWVQEQPSWFTAGLVAKIPDDMLPLHNLLGAHVEAKRNKSLTARGALRLITASLKNSASRLDLANVGRRAKRMSSTLRNLDTMRRLSNRMSSGRLSLTALRRASIRSIQRRHDDATDLRFDRIEAAVED
jgi:hypothetical protein